MLNAALEAGREAAAKAMTEGTEKVTRLIGEEMLASQIRQQVELESIAGDIKRHAQYILLASCAALGAAILLLIA